jgi:hypothetical protein
MALEAGFQEAFLHSHLAALVECCVALEVSCDG